MNKIVQVSLVLFSIIVNSALGEVEPSSGVVGAKSSHNAQFDFWIGEWETAASVSQDWNDVKPGLDTIRYSLNGRLIEEVFLKQEGNNFQRGYMTYLVGMKKWHHTIYDEKWGMYVFEGQFEDGKIELVSVDERPGFRRETFYNIEPNSFDYLWEGSSDGKVWKPVWKVKYKRKGS